jgi:hypothetical protein
MTGEADRRARRNDQAAGERGPRLEVNPNVALQGAALVLRGTDLEVSPYDLHVDGKPMRPMRVVEGHAVSTSTFMPAASGSLVANLATYELSRGKHEVELRPSEGRRRPIMASFELLDRGREAKRDEHGPTIGKDGQAGPEPGVPDLGEDAWLRAQDFFVRRFGHLGFVPPGTRETQIDDVRRLRGERDRGNRRLDLVDQLDRPPLEGGDARQPDVTRCNWTPAGPSAVALTTTTPVSGRSWAGRTLAIAIDPNTSSTVYAGTAGGGVWKTVDDGENWTPKSDYQRSLAVGALAIDPNNSNRIFAGTGEYNDIGWGQLYGNGLLYSSNGGDTWLEYATTTFARDEISRILFDPTDSTSQRMFLASATGVYASTDGGVNWTVLRAGAASGLELLEGTGGMPPPITLIAGFQGAGLWTATRTGTATWAAWTQITSAAFPSPHGRIALAQCASRPRNFFAAFENAAGLAGMASSSDGGATWTAVAGPPSGQAWYNFALAIQPNDQNTVLYGEVGFHRTTTGAAPWSDVGFGLHTDIHAIVYDPNNSSVVWVGSDGGIFRSTDGATNFTTRNRDVATLQYFALGLHPQYEGVMLGGTQDNGVHRTLTSPVGQLVASGDGGFCAIDPLVAARMFHGNQGAGIWRSDDAGATWNPKGPLTASVAYPPFLMDAANSGVCYFGGTVVSRSANAGDTWAAITGALTGGVSALAIHPTDSNTLYAGTSSGRIYRIQRTGATWNLADVTTTDITSPGMPPYVSSVAVDSAGTVWASFSAVLWAEPSGEFTNDHVWRRTTLASAWEVRSNGLALANPVNSIVVDPTNDNRLFCGADVGVFRTENAGGTWAAWDEGIPNAAVFALAIHGPRRLVRAATHGRSIWERPIDAVTCPTVDLYVRDTDVDSGRVQPTLSGVPHPFTPTVNVWWWQSPDVKVDSPTPGFQTAAPFSDYLSYHRLEHRSADRGATNRFYVQVHNRGVLRATSVQVRGFFANASAGLPALPGDFWTSGRPFSADPSGTAWLPIGTTRTIAELEPAEPGVVEWDWTVPSTAAEHSCLFVVTTCMEDPLNVSGVFDVGTLVTTRKQVGLRNLHVVGPTQGTMAQVVYVELHNPEPEPNAFEVALGWGSLPKKTKVSVAFEKTAADRGPSADRARDVKVTRVPAREAERLFADEYDPGWGRSRRIDPRRAFRVDQPDDIQGRIPTVVIDPKGSLAVAIRVELPRGTKAPAQFDVIQLRGRKVVGGSTFVIQPGKS